MIQRVPLALLATLVLLGDLAVVSARQDTGPTTTSVADGASGRDRDDAREGLDDQLARVTRTVEELRDLRFEEPADVTYVSVDELRADVEDQISAYTPQDAERDQALLVALGQLREGDDLRSLLVTAYGDQVAGYYDPLTGELVVASRGDGERLGAFDEITLAHELAHALVDQQVGLPDLEAFEEGREDALLAAQALVEGDATALMNDYTAVGLSAFDQFQLMAEAFELAETMASFAELPHVLRSSLEFPYLAGERFVRHLLRDGGWAAVDAAYADPPATTLEVIEPTFYGTLQTAPPAPFGDPGEAWIDARTLGFGALDLRLLLEAPGDDTMLAVDDREPVVLAWRGGAIRQWTDADGATAVALHLASTSSPATCQALETWYPRAFPDAEQLVVDVPEGTSTGWDGATQDAVLACDVDGLRFGIAPDLTTAAAAIGA